uniref:Uncharacterized protein n=1 Tax=Siphoviridae sp. ctTXt1 TaxID=2825520 RepID=A0A8S5PAI3_9CAUD|nr:MAG TPA: hypothetical protein [Siphoviridae sp. ctTXt1]DAJ26432.1 MAG TPA: hypothetical protein [Caudoviricetes sp.]
MHKKIVRIHKGVFELNTFFIAKEVLFSSFLYISSTPKPL